jgi:competence protein ComEA
MFRTLLLIALFVAALAGGASAMPVQETQAAPAAKAASTPVNINTASAAQLEELPGIGPKTAQRIVDYRQKNGPFKKVEDLMNVSGIGEKSFLKLKPMVSVGPARPEKLPAQPQ